MQGPGDVQTLAGLSRTKLLAASHKSWHLMLRNVELLAAELGEAHVLNFGVRHSAELKLRLKNTVGLIQNLLEPNGNRV